MTREPSGGAGSVPLVPGFDYVAALAPPGDLTESLVLPPGSWYITHPLGRPAGGTYTEVAFTEGVLDGIVGGDPLSERVLEEVVRRVALDLYGTAWAFTYRPEQYVDAIDRWNMRRRELVIVTSLTVYS